MPKDIKAQAQKEGVTISEHKVIYHLIDHLKEQISERLPLKEEEEILGGSQVIFFPFCYIPSV